MSVLKSSQESPDRFGIVAANSTSYISAMFDCMENGIISVPLREVNDHYRIAAAGVNKVISPQDEKPWLTRKFNLHESDQTALITFTSGTEGSPKGVILTHTNLGDVVQRLNTVMKVDDTISEYVGVPVYHSFGFGRCRAVAASGGRFFVPKCGFNPSEIGEMLKKGEINAISAVPSLWRVLLANEDLIKSHGKRVRWIEIGSQYMSKQEKEKLKLLFPDARIVQHYGLTEASRTTFLEVHQEEGEVLESVGRVLGEVEVKLTSDSRISIRGKHVASQYIIDGSIKPIQDNNGWFSTKDLGVIKDGYLYYKGRADDVINCGGIKVPPEALETKIYASIGGSGGLAVCRKSDPMRGESFLVAVTREVNVDRQRLKEIVLRATQEFGVNAANSITIIEVDELPKTPSGKVQRKKLSEQYALETERQDSTLSNSDTPLENTPIQAAYRRVLNLRGKVEPNDTFISLGGDSLSYVQLSIDLERHLGQTPRGWEEMPIEELERCVPQRHRLALIETSIFFRAIAILGVVANHAHLIPITYVRGGSYLLLLISGANFARFQGRALLQGQWLQTISSLLRNILVPYFAIALLYMLYKQEISYSILLLASNFLPLDAVDRIFGVWFIQVLTQIIVTFTLLLCINPVRIAAKRSPWQFGLGLLVVGIALNLSIQSIWDTSQLKFRLPHMLLWIFVLGWCINFCQSRIQRTVTTIALMVAPIVLGESVTPSQTLWILVGGLALIWQQYIPIPQILKSSIQIISAAAYVIFLTHLAFLRLSKSLFAGVHPLLYFLIAVLGGVLIWALPRLIASLPIKAKGIQKTNAEPEW